MVSTLSTVPVKARADKINVESSYIVDVKTTAMPTDSALFAQTVEQYSYDLSAALYAQIAKDTYGTDYAFYWVVLSKADLACKVYKASAATMGNGAAKMLKAISVYKTCLETGNWRNDSLNKNSLEHTDEVEEI